jgi:hypothetical protein
MSTPTTPSLFETLSGLTPRNTPHPIRSALAGLADFANGLDPHRITSNCPDQSDAQGLVEDLLLLCAKVDRVVEAYGEYAGQHFGGIEMPLFKNQLHDALEGNALYVLTSAGERAQEDQREYEVEPKWWNR